MKNIVNATEEAKRNLQLSFNNQSELTPADRERLWDEQARVILADAYNYDQATVTWARSRKNSTLFENPLKDYTMTEKVGDFFEEVGNQAVSINDSVNPFSEKNRKYILAVATVGILAYFLLPVIVKAFRKDE